MFCPSCGKEVKNKEVFCTSCGMKVLKDETKKNEKTGKGTAVWFFKLLGFFVIVVLVGLGIKQVLNVNYNEKAKALFDSTNNLTEKEYKKQAISVDYGELLRNPSKYVGKIVIIKGKVFQKQESILLVSTKETQYFGYVGNNVYVDFNGEGIIEEDLVNVYGVFTGLESYESALRVAVTVPRVKAKYIKIIETR